MTLMDEISDGSLWGLAALPDVRIPVTFTAIAPISHIGRSDGNDVSLRTQEILTPDGERIDVPFVSGGSLRHRLREAAAWHLCRTLAIPDAFFPKILADLLWSGGAVTETGSAADLARLRRVHQMLPALGLLGYSARSELVQGTLAVRMAHVVCEENAWRLPARLKDHPHAALPHFRSEQRDTRKNIASSPAARYIAAATVGDVKTTQLFWDTQVIPAGSVLWSEIRVQVPAEGHLAALAAALDLAAPQDEDGQRVMTLGGKSASGYGACIVDADLSRLGDVQGMRAEYERRLAVHREEILLLLREVTGA